MFTADHVIRKEWSRIDPKGDPQPGPDVYRFKLEVAKGKTASQEIIEERVFAERLNNLGQLPEAKLREYLAHPAPSAEVKAALVKALALQAKLAEISKRSSDLERSLKTVSDDQGRLRDNLKIIPQSSEPYKRFLDKFVAQETEIENLQRDIRQAQAMLQAVQREHDAFVSGLNAD